MKTNYFSTFLDTLDNQPTKFAAPAAAGSPGTGKPSMDINLVLRALAMRPDMTIADLVNETQGDPGTLIPLIEQLRSFGLADFDQNGIHLTDQGVQVVKSANIK